MSQLDGWLESIGCGTYMESFLENGITPDLYPELTDADLKELGFKLGDRKRFLRAVAELTTNGGEEIIASKPAGRAATPAVSPGQHGERRRLTVMFVDLVGSTVLSSRLDPEEWSEILRSYQNTVAGIVSRYDGHVAQYLGDGALCFFGWPQAREDAAECSVEASLEIIREIADIKADGKSLGCRIGISTGLVVVGDLIGVGAAHEEVAIGEAMNFAARLQAFAETGQIVISESTRRLLGNAFVLEPLGKREFKGLPEAKSIFAVVSSNPAHQRFAAGDDEKLGALVGRDQELSLLLQRWSLATQGEGQVVSLIGEAGIGKSRICHELLDALRAGPHTVVSLQCSAYLRNTPLWPLTSHLRVAAGIDPEAPDAEKIELLETFLKDTVGCSNDTIGVLAGLLNISAEERFGPLPTSPSARRAATLTALCDYIIAHAREKPVLLRVEDTHWIDPTTLEFLEAIIEKIEKAPVMLLVTSRPEGHPDLSNRDYLSSITLNRLGRRGVAEIVERLGGGVLPAETIEAIIERTDGIPLFVEELTKAMIERGDMSVPESLHDTLMARLDRLPGVKEIAQIAAVFGREFESSPLSKVADSPQLQLVEALNDLRNVELIFARDRNDQRFIFKHALVRDAAYESLLNRRREEIHGRIFDVLSADQNVSPAVLAHHAAEAHLTSEAIRYGCIAAEEALRRPAYAEAITHLGKTLGILSGGSGDEETLKQRKQLLLLSGQAHIAYHGYAAASTSGIFNEIESIATETGDNDFLIEGLYGRWASRYVPGYTKAALEHADKICDVSEHGEDRLAKALGHRLRGSVLTMMGRVNDALEALSNSERYYDPHRHGQFAARFGQDVGIACDCYRLGIFILQGKFDSASAQAEKVVNDLDRVSHAHTSGYALGHLACFLCAAEIVPLGPGIAQKCIDISQRDSMPLWSALGQASVAMAQVHSGEDAETTLDDLKTGLDALEAVDFGIFRTLILPSYAVALQRSGDATGAQAAISEARDLIERNGTEFFEAEVIRIEGFLAHEAGDLGLAEERLRLALDRAHMRGHLAWEVRAAADLEALLRKDGRGDEGREILSRVYSMFSEGHSHLPLTRVAERLSKID